MERYVYRSHNAYLEAQLTKTEKCWFDGRRLSQHLHNISKLLRCLVRLSWALPKDARVLCMGVRRGLELVAWEWKGYRNVSGVELSPKREYDKIITADFSHLQDFVPDRSCDVIYACHSFEHCYDPETTAREWKRILKANGIVWLSLPTALGKGYTPSESDPVMISRVAELEALFDPLRVVWLITESKPKRGFEMNAILLNPHERGSDASRRVLREMRHGVRAGILLSRTVRELSRVIRRLNGTDRDYSLEICMKIGFLRDLFSRHGNSHQSPGAVPP